MSIEPLKASIRVDMFCPWLRLKLERAIDRDCEVRSVCVRDREVAYKSSPKGGMI